MVMVEVMDTVKRRKRNLKRSVVLFRLSVTKSNMLAMVISKRRWTREWMRKT